MRCFDEADDEADEVEGGGSGGRKLRRRKEAGHAARVLAATLRWLPKVTNGCAPSDKSNNPHLTGGEERGGLDITCKNMVAARKGLEGKH